MAMWKKALVLVVASLVVVLPVVTKVTMARPLLLGVFPTKEAAQQALGTSSTASQSSVVLPQGKELGDEELSQTDGEWWPIIWYFAEFVVSGGGAALAYRITCSRLPTWGKAIGTGIITAVTTVGDILLGQAADKASKASNNKVQNSNSSDQNKDKSDQVITPLPLMMPQPVQHQSRTIWDNG